MYWTALLFTFTESEWGRQWVRFCTCKWKRNCSDTAICFSTDSLWRNYVKMFTYLFDIRFFIAYQILWPLLSWGKGLWWQRDRVKGREKLQTKFSGFICWWFIRDMLPPKHCSWKMEFYVGITIKQWDIHKRKLQCELREIVCVYWGARFVFTLDVSLYADVCICTLQFQNISLCRIMLLGGCSSEWPASFFFIRTIHKILNDKFILLQIQLPDSVVYFLCHV